MNLSDLSSIASLVSGIAVVVSLVYLAQQIRQNTKHSQALIQQAVDAQFGHAALSTTIASARAARAYGSAALSAMRSSRSSTKTHRSRPRREGHHRRQVMRAAIALCIVLAAAPAGAGKATVATPLSS